MAKTPQLDAPFRKGERVTVTANLPGIPEGTTGKVKLVAGLKWTRYWVFFDNGIDRGSIGQDKLVRTKQWEQYKVARAEAASRPAGAAAASAADAGTGGADSGAAPPAGAGSRVPEHLIERTKRRREQLGLA